MFWCDSKLETFKVPDHVRVICKDSFNNCSNLVRIEIPSSVVKIEESAFKDCRKISAVSIIRDCITNSNSFYYNTRVVRY